MTVQRLKSLGCLAIVASICAATEFAPPFKIYKTEPSFIPNAIKTEYHTHEGLAPGYIFIAPHIARLGYGPQIVDHDGDLIWYGEPSVTHIEGVSVYAMDFYVCDFQGEFGNHLCYSEAHPGGAEDHGIREGGVNRIFNNAYESVVQDFGQIGRLTHPNPHEFNMLPGGDRFIQTVYQRRKRDLRDYHGDKDGWIFDGCFQEIDIQKREVFFAWCTSAHLELWESYLYLNIPENTVNFSTNTGGSGVYNDPWDFTHLNSIDKNSENNYLLSSRHMSEVIQVAGPDNAQGVKPGTIMWRLAGKSSSFTFPDELLFTRQHHARYVSVAHNETVISLFNNAWDGFNGATRNQSAAMIIRLNNQTMKASLDGHYENPKWMKSVAQGNTVVLPNGNVFVGWGSHPWWSEFDRNGTLLYHAEAFVRGDAKLANYRAFKMPWVGRPKTEPKVVVYCKTCRAFSLYSDRKTSPLIAYVSWNGATEVKSWRFYLTAETTQTAWILVDTFPKKGFETKVTLESLDFTAISEFPRWVAVEALDSEGEILGRTVVEPFVPNYKVKKNCNRKACHEPERFEYNRQFSRNRSCATDSNQLVQLLVVAFLLVVLETADRLFGELLGNKLRTSASGASGNIYEQLGSDGSTMVQLEHGHQIRSVSRTENLNSKSTDSRYTD